MNPPPDQPTIGSDPKEINQDLRLAAAHGRGIPASLAQKFYQVVAERVEDEQLPAGTLAKLGNSVAAFAKADIETGRYEKCQPSSTVSFTQQMAVVSADAKADEQLTAMYGSMYPPSKLGVVIKEAIDGTNHDSNGEQPGSDGAS